MDIRDITEDVIYPEGRSIKVLFDLQKILVDHYVKIEGLPFYPVDINTKESQILLKDFSGRIIEELGEGFESYEIMMGLFHYGIGEEDMIPHLQNFNEEIADAIHFWLELMIFSGYEEDRMAAWLGLLVGEHYTKADPLRSWLKLGEKEVDLELQMKKIPCRWVIKDHMLTDEFLRGGRQLGTERMNVMKQYLWDITYHLQMARNTLKNKPWKQTGMMTDMNQYEESMIGTAVAMFKFFYFAGFSVESLYLIYFKKNKVNQFRIKSKY